MSGGTGNAMAFIPFRKIRVGDDDPSAKNINLLQDNVAECLQQLTGKDDLDMVRLPSVAIASGVNKIPHKLGRKLTGWIVIRWRNANPTLNDSQDTNASPHLTLVLNSVGTGVLDLLVF